jgi:hypothetical protein
MNRAAKFLKMAQRCFASLIFSVLFVACNRAAFPPLKNGDALRLDCVLLLEKFPEGEIPNYSWPASIKDLKPVGVVREKDNIKIWLYQERGKFAGGYHVFGDPQFSPSTKGVWIEKTKYKGIYVFKTAY